MSQPLANLRSLRAPILEPDKARLDWGEYLQNSRGPRAVTGLRVALFVSYDLGIEVFRSALTLEKTGAIQIVGVATDAVADPRAKISKARRTWKYFNRAEQATLQARVEDLAANHGIDCFTGNVKSEFFSEQVIPAWAPELIFMCGFGQLVPPRVFEHPKFGMYNFHPSDLLKQKYAGPDPFGDLVRNREVTTVGCIHHVNAEFDQGKVVGVGPHVALIDDKTGKYIPLKHLPQKLAPMAGRMAVALLRQVIDSESKVDELDFVTAFVR
jgi:folate-dependent phosphoribosylglycinamide formyltransferase PurN